MPTYLFAYHGSSHLRDTTEQPDLKRAWAAWTDKLGDALAANNNPLSLAKTIDADGSVTDGGGPNPVLGLSFIVVDNIDVAIMVAETCPHLAAGGSIQVAELAANDI